MNKTAVGNTLLLAMLGLGALAGCSKKQPPSAAAPISQTPPEPSSSVPAPASLPAAPPIAAEQPAATSATSVSSATARRAAASGAAIGRSVQQPTLQAVRTGKQPGADRVVFQFDAHSMPAWHAEYVDRPVRDCGSGEPVPVAGAAWLQVSFNGAQAHTAQGANSGGSARRALPHAVARELVRTCDFEGEVTWVVGVSRPNAFTARTMTAPYRLVIDIAH
ncbi:MAG: hypothetical protein H7335_14285 [Massilia sp.]|nr:hypothetical protein [Massilia sp.]